MTTSHDVLDAAQALRARRQPFALVTVLRVAPPASARPGDKAVVTADGIAHGWIGGGCAQPAVLKTVRAALADGRARLIRIAPAAEGSVRELDEVLEFGMACHSGGTLELFVDPVMPEARLVVVGDTPLAAALAGLAPRVGLPVTVIAHDGDPARFPDAERFVADDGATAAVPPGAFVVVATQGRRDLQGLRAALAVDARRVYFVASARKAAVLKASLVEAGADAGAVEAIVAPAGQAIGAQTPEEIALSVLAAVVAERRTGTQVRVGETAVAVGADGATDTAPPAAGAGAGAGAMQVSRAVGTVSVSRAAGAVSVSRAAGAVSASRAAVADSAAAGGSCCGGGAPGASAPDLPAPAPRSSCCGG
jgi:xanthine dehydrogenase accessory factor